MALVWKTARARAFEAELALYPATLTIKGAPYDCICSNLETVKAMRENNYDHNSTVSFSMREADFLTSGVTERDSLSSFGLNFQIYAISRHPDEPSVGLRCNIKQ